MAAPAWTRWAAAAALAVLVGDALADRLARRRYELVETNRVHLDAPSRWVDPRWRTELAALLAAQPPFAADDAAGREELVARVAALSFVREVGAVRVAWPDGVSVPVRLRQPVACIKVGERFQPVAADGTLLSGSWPAPPRVGAGWLPVIGPNDGSFDRARAGQVLAEPRHVDALAVALSMRAHFGPRDLAALGRVAIDATRARVASVEEPGVRLLLEDERLVLFGRAPNADAPGELPERAKWTSLARGLALLALPAEGATADERAERDWALLDVRWDTPELALREDERVVDAR